MSCGGSYAVGLQYAVRKYWSGKMCSLPIPQLVWQLPYLPITSRAPDLQSVGGRSNAPVRTLCCGYLQFV